MDDPFDALRAPVEPVEPDANFAARLRARLERALDLPEGAHMPRTAVPEPTSPNPTHSDSGTAGVVPYLAVGDARRALAWYADALGARLRGEPIVMPDGRVGHAELELAGGVVMLADEHPGMGFTAPVEGEGTAVTLHVTVSDVDERVRRVVEAGGHLDRPPADNPYGRNAVVVDPFGHRWLLSGTPTPTATRSGPGHGEVSYASLWRPDVEAAAAFYAAVLGWRVLEDGGSQGRQVEGLEPRLGLWGGQAQRTTLLCFAVDDVGAAVERVRAAGGEAGDPRREPYGVVADCLDDQGLRFSLSEAADGGGRRGPAVGPGHGELAYLSIGVPDTSRARTFFGHVLGWRFTPGRVEDGWNVEGVWPLAGMHGGAEMAVVVPMFAVDDVATAVEAVRAAGGTATDPERMPYGITADCTDDQGGAFHLGQLH